MMPALPRLRGEGWTVWVDEEGLLWTKDTSTQHVLAAAARVAAIRRILATHPVRGLLVDDRQYRGGDSAMAKEAYAAFVAAHPHLPMAVVTTHPDTVATVREVRQRAGATNLRFFKSVHAAKAWLRAPWAN